MPDRDVRLRLLVEAINKASRQLQEVSNDLLGIKSATDKANASSKKMGTEGTASVNKFAQSLDKLNAKFKAAQQGADRMVQAGKALAVTGATLGAAAFFPIREAALFERSMSRVAAVTSGSSEQFAALTQEAKKMGRETQFTAIQAADGIRFLGMAGLEADEALSALGPTLDLAAAGELGMAEAADYATNITSAFQLKVADLGHVMDVMAYTAANSNTDVRQLADAMKYAGPIAAAAGVKLDQAASIIGTLSSNGIQASLAGTTLRGVVAALVKPSNEAKAAMERLGVTTQTFSDGSLDLQSTMELFAEKGLSAADAFTIFRRTAASGAVVLANNVKPMKDFTEAIEGSDGAAAKMRKTIEDNLVGAFDRFKSAISGFLTAVGTPLIKQLGTITDGVASFINVLTEWAEANPLVAASILKMVAGLALLLTAVAAILVPLGLLVKGLAIAGSGLVTLATVIPKVTLAVKSFTVSLKAAAVAGGSMTAAMSAGVWTAIAASIYLGVKAMYNLKKEFDDPVFKDAMKNLRETQERTAQNLDRIKGKYADFAGVVNAAFRQTAGDIKSATTDELVKQQEEIAKSVAHWRVYRIEQEIIAKKKSFWGRETEETRAAQVEINKANEYLKQLKQTKSEILDEQNARGVDIVGAEYTPPKKTKELTEAEVELLQANVKALEELENYRIDNMEESLAQIDALQKREIEQYEATADAAALKTEEKEERIGLIREKYGRERKAFIENQSKEETALRLQLAEAELSAVAAVQDGQRAELERQNKLGLLTMEDYYADRQTLLTERTEAELALMREKLSSATDDEKPIIEIGISISETNFDVAMAQLDAQLTAANLRKFEKEQESLNEIQALKARHASEKSDEEYNFDQELAAYNAHTENLVMAAEARGAGVDEIAEIYALRGKDRAEAQADFEIAQREKVLNQVGGMAGQWAQVFGDLYEASGKKQKEFLIAQKALAISQSIINTYIAATKALAEGGPYLGPALMATMIATGMAQVAMIAKQSYAAGGEILGYSPHPKADNIPIMATAGEYMMPVKAVQKYGAGVMEGIRRGLFPSEMFDGYSVQALSIPRRPGRYAEGGAVKGESSSRAAASPGGQSPPINITNIVDPAMVEQQISSNPGQKQVMNVLTENQFQLRQLVFS